MAARKTESTKPTPKSAGPSSAARRKVAARAKRSSGSQVVQGVAVTDQPKHKLVRDSFTIPKTEYTVLGDLKQRAGKLGRPAKKSEVLRAGIASLKAMSDEAFLAILGSVPSLKTGRPKKSKD